MKPLFCRRLVSITLVIFASLYFYDPFLPFFPNLLIMVPLRFFHHWAFWNGLFRGMPGLWAYLTPSFLADIMGYVIFVGPLVGSSDVVGFGGGRRFFPWIEMQSKPPPQRPPAFT